MTLQQMHYFVAAVRHGSLSAAAEALYISQPSLSEQIRRLERELGAPVFIRTNRRLRLTEAGRALLPHAEQALTLFENARSSVREIQALEGGLASFGTFSTAFQFFLADVIEEFRRRYPAVRLRFLGLNSQEVADAVREGDLEAGLVQLPIDDRELDVRPPVMTHEVVYLSRDPERTTAPMTIELLATRPLVLSEVRWSDTDPIRRQLRERSQKAGVPLEPTIEVEFQKAALELAARGVADTVVSLPAADSLGFTGALSWSRFEPPLYETYSFVTRKGARPSAATLELMRMIHDHLNGPLPMGAERVRPARRAQP
ncbi:LysR family transcriptional regulator [Nocardiopsis sediminis]|uniref:LysR family transcriptional regulator n=1 Tax=Nocardiopsis sediminis TaxID=1778267 RepID=A0ABV8FND1_9ACTN